MLLQKYKAQTLIEVTMSIGIASIVIVALVVLATSALRNSQESLRKSESTKFANAGIEAVIFYKNVNGFEGIDAGSYSISNVAAGSTLVWSNDPNKYVNIESPSGLVYQRNIKIAKASGVIDVTSDVKWSSTQGEKHSTLNRKITDWK